MANGNSQKRIYVWAYFQQNLGDDMFVQTLVRRYPGHLFYIAANPDNVRFLKNEPNVKIMPRAQFTLCRLAGKISPSLPRKERKMRMEKADAVVKIGGSVFIEYTGWQNAPDKIPNPEFYIIGANFGPYKTDRFFQSKRDYIVHSKDCCFRDLYSYRLFEDIPQVRYAPDILWAYPGYPTENKGQGVGISVLNLSEISGLEDYIEEYEQGIVRICDWHAAQGRPVTLFGFCKRLGDDQSIDRILSCCKSKEQISAEVYDCDIGGFLEAFNRVETVYATRFHAMVLGFAMHKKIIPIIYSNKQSNMLADIGFGGMAWNLLSREPISDEIIRGDATRLSDEALNELRLRSEEQFCGLDESLLASN